MPKSPFTAKELEEFKSALQEKRERILKEITEQKAEISHEAEETGDVADLATDLLDRELNMTLSETERQQLVEIDEALARITEKTYGICVDTGEVINKVRLKAMPEAKRTLQAQEIFDKQMKDKKKRMMSQ